MCLIEMNTIDTPDNNSSAAGTAGRKHSTSPMKNEHSVCVVQLWLESNIKLGTEAASFLLLALVSKPLLLQHKRIRQSSQGRGRTAVSVIYQAFHMQGPETTCCMPGISELLCTLMMFALWKTPQIEPVCPEICLTLGCRNMHILKAEKTHRL